MLNFKYQSFKIVPDICLKVPPPIPSTEHWILAFIKRTECKLDKRNLPELAQSLK